MLFRICMDRNPLSRKRKMLCKSSWILHPVRYQWCIPVKRTLYIQYRVYSVRLTSVFCFLRITIRISDSHQTNSFQTNFLRVTLKIHETCYAAGIEFEILLWLILHFIYILRIYCIQMRVKRSFYFGRSRKTNPFTSSLDSPVFHYQC